MVKKILLGLVGLAVVGFGVSMFMPSKWHVERSVSVKATPELIYASVADLKQWESWTVWNKEMDPSSKTEYSGSPMGQGAMMSWKGEKMGTGSLTLTKGDPKAGVSYEMKMEGMTPSGGNISFTADGQNTKVTWTGDGDVGMNPIGRFMVSQMDKMLGDDFQKGLEKLKASAEKAQAAADEAAAQAAAKAKAEAEAAAAAAAAAEAAAAEAAKNPVKPASGKKK